MLLLKPTAVAPPQRLGYTNNGVEQNWEEAWNLLMTVRLPLCVVFAIVYGACEFVQRSVYVSKKVIDREGCVCAYSQIMLAYSMPVSFRGRDYAFENGIVDEHMHAFMNVLRWHACA